MQLSSVQTKTCRCGEEVPVGCVRCRECGDFLNERTRKYHTENIADNDAVWMVFEGRRQVGPFAASQLRQSFARNDFSIRTLVWKPGLSDWIEAHRVAELTG